MWHAGGLKATSRLSEKHTDVKCCAQTGKGLAERPPFSLADMRNAIPEHCWQKNTWRSFGYLARDVAVVFGLAAAAYAMDSWYTALPLWAVPCNTVSCLQNMLAGKAAEV